MDEAPEDLVGEEQVRARDQTGDEDDGGALDQLLLAGPVDLLQLTPGLGHEVAEAAAGQVAAAVGRRGLGCRAQLLLARRARRSERVCLATTWSPGARCGGRTSGSTS